eukprot:g50138.t1
MLPLFSTNFLASCLNSLSTGPDVEVLFELEQEIATENIHGATTSPSVTRERFGIHWSCTVKHNTRVGWHPYRFEMHSKLP